MMADFATTKLTTNIFNQIGLMTRVSRPESPKQMAQKPPDIHSKENKKQSQQQNNKITSCRQTPFHLLKLNHCNRYLASNCDSVYPKFRTWGRTAWTRSTSGWWVVGVVRPPKSLLSNNKTMWGKKRKCLAWWGEFDVKIIQVRRGTHSPKRTRTQLKRTQHNWTKDTRQK